jgi:hypothetical protein
MGRVRVVLQGDSGWLLSGVETYPSVGDVR